MTDVKLDQYDQWLAEDGPVALTLQQELVSVEGKDAVVFPPTYPIDKSDTGYNIDTFEGAPSVCQIDSVGSQANRMEPIFGREDYRELVPQVSIAVGDDHSVDLLEAGHRAADAIVRYSNLATDVEAAFTAWQSEGNAVPLAKLAPTSIVFGAWDSRGTQAKLPRLVRSVIRAFKVRPLHRSALYEPPVDYVAAEQVEAPGNKSQKDVMSELGFQHAPATWTHGGVLVEGEIRRDATLNLVALRGLGAGEDNPIAVRRYVLGLALVAFTAPLDGSLREGCQLVPDVKRPATHQLVNHDGKREPLCVKADGALAYARLAAEAFVVGENREAEFDSTTAREALGQSKEDRKKARKKKGK